MMRDGVQSVVMIDDDGDKEKVAYGSSGWAVKGIVHASKVKFAKLTQSPSPEGAEGGPM